DQNHRPSQYLQSTHFHPTFFYEAVLDIIFFLVLIKLSKNFKKRGQVFYLYLILYSAGRFIIEFERIDTWTIGSVKVAHVLSLITILLGMILFVKAKNRGLTPH